MRIDAHATDANRERIRRGMVIHNVAYGRRCPDAVFDDDIACMVRLYDTHFFGNALCSRIDGRITYRFSTRMTKVGGKVAYDRGKKAYVLSLSYPLIVRSYAQGEQEYDVNGIMCASSLDAMMCVLEHELVHLLEFELYGKSSCSRRRFRVLAGNIFGHTGTKHSLGVSERRRREATLLPLGSKVRFSHGGRTYTGTLRRVTKRATVIIDPSCGGRYEKFYVPLEKLTAVV